MKKYLVVRFSSIGDIVLTSPVIRCLHENGHAEVHFLTKETFTPLVRANPHITKCFTIRHSIGEVIGELRAERYDMVIDLHRNLRSTALLLRLRRPFRRFRKLNFRKWLLVRFKWDLMPARHIVDRYMDTVIPLGVTYDGQGLDFFISEEDEVNPADWADGLEQGYFCLAVGSQHATKQLPDQHIITLAAKLELPLVLLGGPGDHARAEQVRQACTKGSVVNLAGSLNIAQSASMVRQAKALVTGDTGLMHIAAALRKPLVSLWGNTVPAFGMTPFYPEGSQHLASILEVEGLSCRPCSKLGFDECPKGHFKCMMQIDPAQILIELGQGSPD